MVLLIVLLAVCELVAAVGSAVSSVPLMANLRLPVGQYAGLVLAVAGAGIVLRAILILLLVSSGLV